MNSSDARYVPKYGCAADPLTLLRARLPAPARTHSAHVAILADMLAEQADVLGLLPYTRSLYLSGEYHNIGESMGLARRPEQVPLMSEQVLRENISVLLDEPNIDADTVFDAARHHCERLDGSGYPDCLRGYEISLAARLVGLADMLDVIFTGDDGRYELHANQALRFVRESGAALFGSDAVGCFDAAEDKILHMVVEHRNRVRDLE